MKRQKVACDAQGISQALDLIQEELERYQLDSRSIRQAMLLAEESMIKFSDLTPEDARLEISIRRYFLTAAIRISAPGAELRPGGAEDYGGLSLDMTGLDSDAERTLRDMLLRAFADRIKYKHVKGRNTVQITAGRLNQTTFTLALLALAAAFVLGLALRLALPAPAQALLNGRLFAPLVTVFLNALKMIISPVVFFSIVALANQCANYADFGKVGLKIFFFYVGTTLLAIFTGLGVSHLIRPGHWRLLTMLADPESAAPHAAVDISVWDTVLGIVPSNFIQPFYEDDALQIIFIALLCGVAVGLIGDYSKPLQDFFAACHTLFLKIASLLTQVVPLAMFISVTSLIMSADKALLFSLLAMIGTLLLGLAGMAGLYCLLIALAARTDPRPFLRKYLPAAPAVFKIGSNLDAMPLSLRLCREGLGISPKVYSLSIPIGSTINMDGSCVYMAVAGPFLARLCGVDISDISLFSMAFVILLLSASAPNAPGSGLVSLAAFLNLLEVPIEAITVIIGVDIFLGMLCAVSNTMGDIAVSLIVARQEHLVDMDVYQRRPQEKTP